MNYSPNDLQSYLWENPRQNMGKSTSKYGKIHVKIYGKYLLIPYFIINFK